MLCGHRQHASQSNDIIYAKDSLLKYEPRRLIVSRDVSDADYKKICRATISPSSQPISLYDTHLNLFDPYSDLCRSADILDVLFPPIEYIDTNNHKYIKCVSRHPATKIDLYNLEKNLDCRLKQAQALEIGLCKHRRNIYDECFDELVRQITIECSERGILLSRVRNTYRRMMKDYLNSYLSANAYAMRTLLLSEKAKAKLNNQIDHLQYEIEEIKNQLINAEDRYENILKLDSTFKSSNEYRHPSINVTVPFELQQLRTTNRSLKQELENVLLKKLHMNPSERINKNQIV
ncbi:unnamed protein product [Rotaria magnacalcarata]|uniref:Uncharacterized protein n=1 Tax=Rotaria magnacalcarata TaxID=392030 RepID=A0A815NIM4_9BILA|nr:unnamed protein product [Rotaria magnacalcarata]CAF4087154.1 unnamed protein product [Rotaria magnacalcarata]